MESAEVIGQGGELVPRAEGEALERTKPAQVVGQGRQGTENGEILEPTEV